MVGCLVDEVPKRFIDNELPWWDGFVALGTRVAVTNLEVAWS